MFSSAVDRIEAAYERLGMELGWRFLYTPASTLSCPNGVMLVGLNPGGDEHGVTPSVEEGNAYLVEDWPGDGASLQDQIHQFFAALHQAGAASGKTPREALHGTLTTNYCPFRAPTWGELPRKEGAKRFSNRFWRWLLPKIEPDLVLCMGRKPYRLFQDILREEASQVGDERHWPTGWGDIQFDALSYRIDHRQTTIVFIPHLSRFKLMSREESVTRVERFARDLGHHGEVR